MHIQGGPIKMNIFNISHKCNRSRYSETDFTAPQPLPFIEQVTVTKHLGIYISVTFLAAAHVEHILSTGPD